AALALRLLTEADRTRVLGEDRRILRFARLEQIRDARQTAGDVAGLGRLLRDTRDDVADRDLRPVLEADDRAGRQRIHRRDVGVRERDFLALRVHQLHDRTQVLAARAALLRIHHDGARQARHFVDLALNGQAVDEVLELDEARHFRDDRVRVRIPRGQNLTGLDRIAVLHVDRRAVRNLVALALATEFVDHAELAGAGYRDPMALLVMHRLQVVQTGGTATLRFDRVRRGGTRGR